MPPSTGGLTLGDTLNCLLVMTTPLGFLKALTTRLSHAELPFAVTSGMACVFYGLQQTTVERADSTREKLDRIKPALE